MTKIIREDVEIDMEDAAAVKALSDFDLQVFLLTLHKYGWETAYNDLGEPQPSAKGFLEVMGAL